MTNDKHPTGLIELSRIPLPDQSPTSDDNTSIPDEADAAKRHGSRKFESFTPDEERAVVRKLDLRLVLFVALLYLLSFLDRSNIGNAKIAGLSEDLKLSSSQYEWLLSSFYCTYIAFQWMTLLYSIIPAHIYIALCVASWSLIASLQAVAGSFAAMVVLRALLGIAEAAFSPGVPFLLSFFYKRDELAFRTGLFISAAPLATSFAGSLAWLISKAGDNVPIANWRLLFLIEGFPSIVVAVFAWYWIPDAPDTARYLNRREKVVARLRLEAEKPADRKKLARRKSRLDWREIREALTDKQCWITAVMFFSCNVAFSSLPPFLPTIIHEMGYSALSSQALSAPPYLLAFLLVLLTAHLSDRFGARSPFIIFHALLASTGYFLLALLGYLQTPNSIYRYLAIYPAAAGFFSAITLIITWTLNNQHSDEKRGTGVAMLNLVGQFGPLLGTRLYPDEDGPFYVKGMAVCSGFMLGVAGLAWWLRVILARENAAAAELTEVEVSLVRKEDDDDDDDDVVEGGGGGGGERLKVEDSEGDGEGEESAGLVDGKMVQRMNDARRRPINIL